MIFDEAVELQTAERESFVSSVSDAEISVEVRKMLASDAVDLFELSPVRELVNETNGSALPEKIGVYKIVREIGRGGMGAVYLAERDDGEFKQKVAIKIIKRGMDSDEILRRFRKERQILAELQHLNIARLFDGGLSSDGSPFYAMEFIEGIPIDEYCRHNDISLKKKLELVRQVCSAVSYAHSQLIVHRDLKPSNILVTEDGHAKLLDFGIAKILGDPNDLETATQLGMMTPGYASPEQIRGEKLTTASDIYSLGVILYELMTGERPFLTNGKNYAEVVEMISNSQVSRPSTVALKAKVHNSKSEGVKENPKVLRGDLDNIAIRALQKEASRRYQSVEKFSEDIRRHLAGLPISARPDTAVYRVSKFITRNRISVAAAAIVLLSLCTGITVAFWQARRAERQRTLAEKRFEDVRQLANNVVFKYHDAIAELPGSTKVREMLVKDALQYLDTLAQESSDDANLQNELALAYLKLGDVQGKMYAANVGDTEGSLTSYRTAVALLESVVEDTSGLEAKVNLIKAYDSLAFLMLRSGRGDKNIVRKALELLDQLPDNDQSRLQKIDLYLRLGDSDIGDGSMPDYDIRLSHHLKALPLIEELVRNDPKNFEKMKTAARVYQRIGTDYSVLGNQAETSTPDGDAQPMYEKSLAYNRQFSATVIRMTQLKADDPSIERYQAGADNNLAEALALNGTYEEAFELAKKFRYSAEKVFHADPQNQEAKFDLSLADELFAKIYFRQKNYAKYFEFAENSLAKDEEIYQADKRNLEAFNRIKDWNEKLGVLYERTGNQPKATLYRQNAQRFNTPF